MIKPIKTTKPNKFSPPGWGIVALPGRKLSLERPNYFGGWRLSLALCPSLPPQTFKLFSFWVA